MDVRTLTYFLEIANEQNISRAAENLHMSQPPLTRQMQLLEEELGVQLLVRGKRKVTLTREGEFLKQRAQKILDLMNRTSEEITNVSSKIMGKIYVGSIESISVGIMPRWIDAFYKQYPDVRFSWWSGNSNDVLLRLEHGLVDFAVVRTPCDNEKFASISLMKEPWMLYIHEDFARQIALDEKFDYQIEDMTSDKVQLKSLKDIPLIIPSIKTRESEIENWFSRCQMRPNIICEISPAMNAFSLVEQGMGAAILPKAAQIAVTGRGIIGQEIINPSMESEIIIAYNRVLKLSPAASAFIEFIVQQSLSGS